MYPDDESVEKWFEDGPLSPHGGSDRTSKTCRHPTMPCRCKNCRKFLSARVVPTMERSKRGCQSWLIAIYLLATGIRETSCMKLYRDLSVTRKAAWHVVHRICEGWDQTGTIECWSGQVEVDETYISNLETNKHEDRKLIARRGDVGKTAVAGLKERETGTIPSKVVGRVDKATLQRNVTENVEQGSRVFMDEYPVYREPPYTLEIVNHSIGKWVDGMTHNNSIESFWSLFKCSYHGTCHRMSVQLLDRYVTEFEGRHNKREDGTKGQMREVDGNMITMQLRYQANDSYKPTD